MSNIKLRYELERRAAWVLSIYGAGGSGKTTLALFLMDKWFPDSKLAFFRYPSRAMAALPDHIRSRARSFDSMAQIVGKPYVVFLDDTAIHFLSRSTSNSSNKDFVSQLTLGRHNDHKFIITAQSSILVDKGIFESLDQFSLRCRMTDFQSKTEREEFIATQLSINSLIDYVSPDSSIGLWFCPETMELMHFPLWPYMTDALSKPYRGCYIVNGQIEGL